MNKKEIAVQMAELRKEWKDTYEELRDTAPKDKDRIEVLQARLDTIREQQDILVDLKPKSNPVDVNTLINGGISLLGIVMVLKHEETNVVASKIWNVATRTLGR